MEQNNNQTSMAVRELNFGLEAILVLVALRHLINIPRSLLSAALVASTSGIVYNILLNILMIFIIVSVFRKKRWAVCAFFVLQLLNPLGQCMLIGSFDDFFPSLFVSLVFCGVFRLLLMLKKDGISAWDTIMKSDEDFESLWQELHEDESDEEDEPVK